MSETVLAELAEACVGSARADVPLSTLTTLRVGGPARFLVTAECEADLAAVGVASRAHDLPTAVVGRGSNVLVSDDGFPGIVVTLGRGYRGVSIAGERVRALAAEPLPTLSMAVADAGLSGFAWASAVPGTVGGAVRMNAGAHGGEIVDHVAEAEVFRLSTGGAETWPAALLGLSYRHSELPTDAVVTSATFRFPEGDVAHERAHIAEVRAWRRAHQPLNEPNCGSVFTNPAGGSAGALIDAAGLKGLCVGGAQVSSTHANFVVTRRGARASDVAELIAEVRRRVEERHGIVLEPEVTWLAGGEHRGPRW